MIKFDYRKNDFKEIKTENNEKRYFIKFGKESKEVTLKIYKLHKQEQQLIRIGYKEDSMLYIHNLDVDKLYLKQIQKKESIHNLYKAIKHLNKEQYYIIYSLYFDEKNESEVAKELNISQQALNKRKKKILLLLKNGF